MTSPFLPDWVLEQASLRPEAPAIATPTVRLTYGDLAERVERLAHHLADDGLAGGDRVLVALPNLPATAVVGLAIQRAGGVPVEVNREWGPEVIGGIARSAGCRRAFAWGRDARAWARIGASAPLDRLWIVHGGPIPPALSADLGLPSPALLLEDGRVDPALGRAPAVPAARLSGEGAAVILYTSGSTGVPRGVVQSHRNVDANTRAIVSYLELTGSDRALLVLPLYYCYGRSVLQTHLLVGGSLFLDGRFAFPRTVLEALGEEGCSGFAGVPITFEIIRRQVDVASLRFPRLRYLTQAGGAMAPDTIAWVRRAFRPARLFVMYGQTEATARLSYLPPERGEEKHGSIGIPIPGVTLAVVDDAGRALPAGEVGHLVARGANVTAGYLDDPEATRAILHDGWLWTGDLAWRDEDGFFFHAGRSKELLKIGGHRVSPVEIEQVLQRFPGIAEAAVVGAADPLQGEVPVAHLVLEPGVALDEDGLRRFCRERMAPYRVPVRFVLEAALPRSEAGKLLRAALATGRPGAGPRP